MPVFLTGISAIGLWGIWWSVGIVWAMAGISAWMRYLQYKKMTLGDGIGDPQNILNGQT
ncbi:MAG: hypothetical protein IKO84_01750 [Butyrivibrio sp.]|nr:hypothetical protein [Butyrivibrio sp.]